MTMTCRVWLQAILIYFTENYSTHANVELSSVYSFIATSSHHHDNADQLIQPNTGQYFSTKMVSHTCIALHTHTNISIYTLFCCDILSSLYIFKHRWVSHPSCILTARGNNLSACCTKCRLMANVSRDPSPSKQWIPDKNSFDERSQIHRLNNK